MKTLDQIRNYLNNALNQLNLASPELDALAAFIANGIYLDQSLATSVVTESNPATCILLNSAIKHALGKMYSVYRGKNLKVRIVGGIKPNKEFKVCRYDTFAEMNGYKLVYAKSYQFYVGENIERTKTNGIDLILCKEVKTGAFLGQGSYAFNVQEPNISEDITIYKPNTATGTSFDDKYIQQYYTDIDEMTHDEVISSNNVDDGVDKILGITDTDFSVTLFNSKKFSNDTYYYYRYLPYLSIDDMSNIMSNIDENINEVEKVKSLIKNFKFFNNFDISDNEVKIYEGADADQYSALPTDRETNIDNIFWLSSVKFTGNDMIRSTNDILDKFKTTFNGRYNNAVAYEEADNSTGYVKKIIIYYIPKGPVLTSIEKSNFIKSINRMQYNSLVELQIDVGQTAVTSDKLYLLVKANKDVTSEINDVLNSVSYSTLSNTDDTDVKTYNPMDVVNKIQELIDVTSVSFDLAQIGSELVSLLSPVHFNKGIYIDLTKVVECTYVD